MPLCDVCGREFNTEVALGQHKKDKHGDSQASPAPAQEAKAQSAGSGKRRTLRRRNDHRVAISIVAIGLVGGIGLYFVIAPALQNNFTFPCNSTEGTFMHVHPYLRIQVGGQNLTIPAGVGIKTGCFEPLHTHATDGIIHIESPLLRNYTLGDFFTIWRETYGSFSFNGTSHPIEFNQTDIFGLRNDSTHRVVLLVDGVESTKGAGLNLDTLDYLAGPIWEGGSAPYPYGTGHTVVIEYLGS
ncbi:MAG: C2H2-type zinc finger protein [archaeon]|nr:MAG: C2H2-type zinc finger protein [archaeon]